MTEYQKTYIELKKQFVATNEGPDSVRALYTFKEELEQSEDQQICQNHAPEAAFQIQPCHGQHGQEGPEPPAGFPGTEVYLVLP